MFGVPIKNVRVVALENLNLKLGHAMLVLYVIDEALLLVRQIASAVPANSSRHHLPIFSINEAVR